jgi:hypothetical protein
MLYMSVRFSIFFVPAWTIILKTLNVFFRTLAISVTSAFHNRNNVKYISRKYKCISHYWRAVCNGSQIKLLTCGFRKIPLTSWVWNVMDVPLGSGNKQWNKFRSTHIFLPVSVLQFLLLSGVISELWSPSEVWKNLYQFLRKWIVVGREHGKLCLEVNAKCW